MLAIISVLFVIPVSQCRRIHGFHDAMVAVTERQVGANCTNSYECGHGLCCRDASGKILSGEVDGKLSLISGEHQTGICSNQLGREGELCDCGCRLGLECYRPMAGMCCVPMRCYDAAFVRKEREYWENCFRNMSICHIPM
ncbi:hypothetical protein ACJMK2_023859 [Sinanodonta woodiana]|uniref:Uncharacterized protein n=1 Tax=Sinanodonta woodiana TaxID=1069815 RepID=A0ABD3T5S7_SINWO